MADTEIEKKKPEKKKSGRMSRWFRELKSEIKKIVWPSWKQIKNNTFVVMVMVLIITLVIFAFDTGFGKIVGLVIPEKEATTTTDQGTTENTELENDTTENTTTEGTTENTTTDGTSTDANTNQTSAQ